MLAGLLSFITYTYIAMKPVPESFFYPAMNVKLTREQRIKILNSNDIFTVMQQVLLRENKIDRDKEHFWMIGLATNNKVLYIELVSLGTLKASLIAPMDAFRVAVLKAAARVILCHNHPSGETLPSEDDKDITKQLIQSGEILSIPVFDHLIISTKEYYSFRDSGLLEKLQWDERDMPPFVLAERAKRAIREEWARQTALAMKNEGIHISVIAKISGLMESEIEEL